MVHPSNQPRVELAYEKGALHVAVPAQPELDLPFNFDLQGSGGPRSDLAYSARASLALGRLVRTRDQIEGRYRCVRG